MVAAEFDNSFADPRRRQSITRYPANSLTVLGDDPVSSVYFATSGENLAGGATMELFAYMGRDVLDVLDSRDRELDGEFLVR